MNNKQKNKYAACWSCVNKHNPNGIKFIIGEFYDKHSAYNEIDNERNRLLEYYESENGEFSVVTKRKLTFVYDNLDTDFMTLFVEKM